MLNGSYKNRHSAAIGSPVFRKPNAPRLFLALAVVFSTLFLPFGSGSRAAAQSVGSAGTIEGTVTDSSGAVVPGASATLESQASGYKRSTTSDESGTFRFDNIPQNNYELSVTANGFGMVTQGVSIRSAVPLSLKISLAPAGTQNTVTVTPGETVENVDVPHVDLDQSRIEKYTLPSPGSGLNDLVALTSPSVAKDSNGFYHPLGDHAQSTIVIDNQPISDQRSKAFSTQLPVDAVQSLEIVSGAPPAWNGDKSSLIVNVVTRSGLDQKQPTGSFSSSYGTFGTTHEEATFGIGGSKFGNFTAFSFDRSGRFLDPPEFTVLHDRGISAGLFDRIDYNPTTRDALHLNIFLSRNNFQIPNQFDQEAIGQDQHQLVRASNVAFGWVHTFNPSLLLTVNPYYRLDQVWYFPSANPFSDQTQTISQQRRLLNAGVSVDLAYNKGRHNVRVGVQANHTFLTEAFHFGITDPNFNDPNSPSFLPGLLPFDLT
ncbi:MAG: carboxypeptidase regulatory-like domain-containing protein, partial [Blastocatellia bacterium]